MVRVTCDGPSNGQTPRPLVGALEIHETPCSRNLALPAHLRRPAAEVRGLFSITTFTMSDPPLNSEQPRPDAAESVQSPSAARQSWRSEELLGGRTEVLIVHGTEVYRLRRTRQDKLILYK